MKQRPKTVIAKLPPHVAVPPKTVLGLLWILLKRKKRFRVGDLVTHLLSVGSSGSAKTTCVFGTIVRACAQAEVPVLVYCAKQEDAEDYARFLAEGGDRNPIVVQPGTYDDPPKYVLPVFDYLDHLGAGAVDAARVFSRGIQAGKGRRNDSANGASQFWQDHMEDILTKVLTLVYASTCPPSLHLVIRCVADLPMGQPYGGATYTLVSQSALREAPTPDVLESVRYLEQEFGAMHPETASNVKATWQTLSSILVHPPMDLLLAEPGEGQEVVSPSTVLSQGRSVILDVPVLTMPKAGRCFQALFQGLVEVATHRRPKKAGQVFVCWDEFQCSVQDESVLTAMLTTARSKGVGIGLATQSMKSVASAFGSTVAAEAVGGLIGTVIATRQDDTYTKKWVSDRAGQDLVPYDVESTGDDGKRSIQRSKRWEPRIAPDTIGELKEPSPKQIRPRTSAIVIRKGKPHRVDFDRMHDGPERFLRAVIVWLLGGRRPGIRRVLWATALCAVPVAILGYALIHAALTLTMPASPTRVEAPTPVLEHSARPAQKAPERTP